MRKNKRKSPVTIIIGLVCKECIVVASDSQTTYQSSFGAAQRLDTPKIQSLEFADRTALVAQSGEVTLSGRAVEILTHMAKGQPWSDYRTAADMAQKAIRQVKEELRTQLLNCTIDELHAYVRENDLHFELMIANYHDQKPYIFTIDFRTGVANLKPHTYTAIGCGGGIASYILSWFNFKDLTWTDTVLTAIYVVEEVKKIDPFCGGKVKVAMLPPGSVPSHKEIKFMLSSGVDHYVTAIQEMDLKAKAEWGRRMRIILDEVNARDNKPPTPFSFDGGKE